MPTKEKNKDLAFRVHGGVIVNGDIRQDASINLVNLRALRTLNEAKRDVLCPYLLGLSLVALLYEQDFNLRQGCQLVLDPERAEQRKKDPMIRHGKYTLAVVKRDGVEEELPLSYGDAQAYAVNAATNFKVNQKETTINFAPAKMKTALRQTADDSEESDD